MGCGGGHAVLPPPATPGGRPGRAWHSPGNLPSSSALAAHRRPQDGARGSQRLLASARAPHSGAPGCGAHGAASRPRRAGGSRNPAASAAPIVCAAPPAARAPLLGSARVPGSGRVGGVGRGPSPAPARCRCERRNPPRSGARSGARTAFLPRADVGGPRRGSWASCPRPGAHTSCAGPRTARVREPRLAARAQLTKDSVNGGSQESSAIAAWCVPKPNKAQSAGWWVWVWRPGDGGVPAYTPHPFVLVPICQLQGQLQEWLGSGGLESSSGGGSGH